MSNASSQVRRDRRHRQREILLFLLLLILGFICLLCTASLSFNPMRSWLAQADMSSVVKLDQELEQLGEADGARHEPVRPEVLELPPVDLTSLAPSGTPVFVPPATLPLPTPTPQMVAESPPSASPTATAAPAAGTPPVPPPVGLASPTPTGPFTPPTELADTPTPTGTPTPTRTPTGTPTPTRTSTPTPTSTSTSTHTPAPPSPTSTYTAVPPQPPTSTPRPTETATPTFTPSPTRTPTHTPTPTTTPTPTRTPTPTTTPTPTATPTSTPTPTQPAPLVLAITPNRGLNTAPVNVLITGNYFIPSPFPTARLGANIFINISAASATALTGTVPQGIAPGIYALTVMNPLPDGRSGTLARAYTALAPSSPDTTLEAGYLSLFGPLASGAAGDDDHIQLIFFELPADYAGSLYFRVFDANTGGSLDEATVGATTMRYALYGGTGAYTDPDARSPHPTTGVSAGTLLTEATVGNDPAYDGNWSLVFGPYTASDGEAVGIKRVFKFVVEGRSGWEGNLYNVALSTDPTANVPPADVRVFAYAWTLPLPGGNNPVNRAPIYPYVPLGTGLVGQYNWDLDYPGAPDETAMTLTTPVREIAVLGSAVSGDNALQHSVSPVGEGEDGVTWSMMIRFANPYYWNDFTFWATGDGTALAIFTHPTLSPPP
ncbi:MAG: hypothetical protein N2508_11030 [Anaerolineae bacterium]|nr:hypothetical protein [Anaerolineae bacterium]